MPVRLEGQIIALRTRIHIISVRRAALSLQIHLPKIAPLCFPEPCLASLLCARHERVSSLVLGDCINARMRWMSYFLPLFFMPCPPVLRGPFPPAFAANSFRAFSSRSSIVSVTIVVQDYI